MKKRIISYLFLISLLLFSGCSKESEEMSTVRPNLILNIFKLVKTKRHDEAIVQVQKLRELDPTNSLLPVLEESEKNNRDLKKINTILRSNQNYEEIPPLLDNIVKQNSIKDKNFLQSVEKLNAILRMQTLVDIIIDPQPTFDNKNKFRPASKVLKDSINEFNKLAKKWNAPASLRRKVNSRSKKIAKLQAEEQLRAVQSLELLAPGLESSSYQTMMALSLCARQNGTKTK
jgi:hypothetical protein